jgi:tetratricopeptide (TPR) repeat protein
VEELTYDLAAAAYADGESGTAIEQINALPSASHSAALQFLLAQSWARKNSAAPEGLQAWSRVRSLAPGALAAYQALGERALAGGHLAEAAKFARRVLVARPNDIRALETLGSAIAGDAGLAESGGQAALIWSRRLAEHPSCETSDNAMMFYRSRRQFAEAAAAQQKLDGCAPESLAYAQSLAAQERHGDAARALQQLLAAAPLNRSARLMLVGELQLAGDDPGAERAAAAWLRIAPNAPEYRRLAAASSDDPAADANFYAPYRRDAAQVMQATAAQVTGAPLLLVNDHVAIARSDGSVSLYVHTATRFSGAEDIERFAGPNLPHGTQILQLRIFHSDGSVTAMKLDAENLRNALPAFSPGDTVDEEYVVNYAGDGGIPEHPEVFQFVFGRFDAKVLSARFIVLTPAGQADRGVVIASSDAPRLVSQVKNNMLARTWERNEVSLTTGGLVLHNQSLAIVRVVEQENGWTVPSDAEHHRRIETIHPGPRFEESSSTVEHGKDQAPKVTKL